MLVRMNLFVAGLLAVLLANVGAVSAAALPRGSRNADHYQPKTKSSHELRRQLKHTVHDRLMDSVPKASKYEHETHQGEFVGGLGGQSWPGWVVALALLHGFGVCITATDVFAFHCGAGETVIRAIIMGRGYHTRARVS